MAENVAFNEEDDPKVVKIELEIPEGVLVKIFVNSVEVILDD